MNLTAINGFNTLQYWSASLVPTRVANPGVPVLEIDAAESIDDQPSFYPELVQALGYDRFAQRPQQSDSDSPSAAPQNRTSRISIFA